MSLTTCERTLTRTDRPDWPGLGPLRWPYVVFDRREVELAGERAVCLSEDGVLWEYDGRHFLGTDPEAGTWRAPAGTEGVVPSGPWRHLPGCTCESCRLGNV